MNPQSDHERGGDDGFSILEVVVALMLFAIVAVAITSSGSRGFQLMRRANARQSATQLAVAEMERFRATSYLALGMATGTTWETADSSSPDFGTVDTSAMTFDVPGGPTEPIVSGGSTVHRRTETMGNSSYQVYVYVTWVDDPVTSTTTEDYKRITTVIQFAGRAPDGGPNRGYMTSLFTRAGVLFPATTSTSSSSTSSTSSSSTSSTSSSSTTSTTLACATDTTPPAGGISVGSTGVDAGWVNTSTPTVFFSASDACTPTANLTMFTGTGTTTCTPGSSSSFATNRQLALPAGQGARLACVRYVDGAGLSSPIYTVNVTVDSITPNTPTKGSPAVTVASNKKTAVINWNTSTDTSPGTVRGYYVYAAVDPATPVYAATVNCTSSPCSYTATTQNNKNYTYVVYAYDGAGNLSPGATYYVAT